MILYCPHPRGALQFSVKWLQTIAKDWNLYHKPYNIIHSLPLWTSLQHETMIF